MEPKNDLKKLMLVQNSSKIYFFLSSFKEKKQKWFFLRSFFGYKKLNRKTAVLSKTNFFFIYFNLYAKLISKLYFSGNSSLVFKKFLNSLFYLKKNNSFDIIYLFLLFLDNLRLPFLLRSKKVAGRLYQIPMVTSIDSQYNQVLRNLIKITKIQRYRVFFPFLLFHLKLSYLNQSHFSANLLNVTTTATDNLRFVRFRWK